MQIYWSRRAIEIIEDTSLSPRCRLVGACASPLGRSVSAATIAEKLDMGEGQVRRKLVELAKAGHVAVT